MQKPDLSDLVAFVLYRHKEWGGRWTTMAAFDVETVAVKYAADCSKSNSIWEYVAVDHIGEPLRV